jgi:activating signal cointegrator 1
MSSRATSHEPRVTNIRAITIHQPYATLLALGLKQYETRTWPTSHRGLLLIHASARQGWTNEALCESMLRHERFGPALLGIKKTDPFAKFSKEQILELFPRKCVVGICDVTNCQKGPEIRDSLGEDEQSVGDFTQPYTPRRHSFGKVGPMVYAWRCENPKRFAKPIPWAGAQGIWIPTPELLDLVRFEVPV